MVDDNDGWETDSLSIELDVLDEAEVAVPRALNMNNEREEEAKNRAMTC